MSVSFTENPVFSSDEEQEREEEFSIYTKADYAKNWPTYELRFGRNKGQKLQDLVRKSSGRRYMRYLLGWDKLRYHTAGHLRAALDAYEEMKATRDKDKKASKLSKEAVPFSPAQNSEKLDELEEGEIPPLPLARSMSIRS
jgi:hypothetical protein